MESKLRKRTRIINILIQISEVLVIVLSLWAATLTFLSLGENFYIQLYAGGYKPAVFTIKELKFYKEYSGGHGSSASYTIPAKYWAFGEIIGNKDKFGLKGYAKGVIESQSDLEKEFTVGQKLQVLYNPNVPKKLEVHIQYPLKDFKNTHKRRQMQMIKYTYGPWVIAYCLYIFLKILTKNVRGIITVTLTSLFFMGMGWCLVLFDLSTMSDNFSKTLNNLFRS